ncbi:hypothetical protein ZHAS_00015200 [Anopheles sinensis]|uniref:Uncharacterized protein n=1 Tax=Anopheles sinensis TaxID=74873 RepID=A0A084WAD4_ANOSI|nr:hypothetical protein ZHAS_00015200 [Anopheles sinensis]
MERRAKETLQFYCSTLLVEEALEALVSVIPVQGMVVPAGIRNWFWNRTYSEDEE